MAQSRFTKEEAEHVYKCVNEIFTALPRKKQMDYLGHLNDALLFLTAAKEAAPTEETK